MKLVKDQTDDKKVRHQRYSLFYKNVRVEYSDYTLHSKDKRLLAADGRIVEQLDIDVSKPITEKQALQIALADQKLEETLFKEPGNLPKGELVLTRDGAEPIRTKYTFAYVFNIGKDGLVLPVDASSEPFRIYVDASSGNILRRQSLLIKCIHMATHEEGKEHLESSLRSGQPVLSKLTTSLQVASTFIPRWGRYGTNRAFERNGFLTLSIIFIGSPT